MKDSKVYKFWHFIHARTKVLAVNAVDAWRNRRFFAVLPIGALVMAIAFSDFATSLKRIFEDTTSDELKLLLGKPRRHTS